MRPAIIDALPNRSTRTSTPTREHHIGFIPGEGIGPELTAIARDVLSAVAARAGRRFEISVGGPIGVDAVRAHGVALTDEATAFFEDVFGRGGAVLCGPGGQRFVYDLRRRFDLFCKVSPIVVDEELLASSRLRPELVRGVDLLVVRDNAGGVYQGEWGEGRDGQGRRFARHAFGYDEDEVRRIVAVGARLAAARSGHLSVVAKHGGVPTVTTLWEEVTREVAAEHGLASRLVDADLAAYQLMHDPRAFDVVVCPNMIGDIIGDLLAVALGSRGLAYSGNFDADGRAVYQTNHGSAFDLVGSDQANPVAHLYALAMMLSESFGLVEEAGWIRAAIKAVWRSGKKTRDLAAPGDLVIGTRELGERVAALVADAPSRAA